ncbi:MAG: tol-pal system protein YbgF [Candidatus Edwardsbacteria bacterium]|nr:tol-pal system protein YbgF [Candidatus Edwardsbacteria bacterium]
MKRILIASLLLPLLAGCSMKRDFAKMQRQIDYLETGQKETQARLAAADSAGKAQARTLAEIRAALWDLSERMGAKAEVLDQLQKAADTARPKVDLLPIGQASPETPPAAKPGAAGAGDKAAYDAAYLEVTRRNYGQAIAGFKAFIAAHPASSLADNARYWIGECLYAQGKYREAGTEFEQVVSAYPGQDKVPAAMLKAGLCRQELGEKAGADRWWRQLLGLYPKSPEALLAREKLKKK